MQIIAVICKDLAIMRKDTKKYQRKTIEIFCSFLHCAASGARRQQGAQNKVRESSVGTDRKVWGLLSVTVLELALAVGWTLGCGFNLLKTKAWFQDAL